MHALAGSVLAPMSTPSFICPLMVSRKNVVLQVAQPLTAFVEAPIIKKKVREVSDFQFSLCRVFFLN